MPAPEQTCVVTHDAGFFSCCSIRLRDIVRYMNKRRELPAAVDSSRQFSWYRPAGQAVLDLTHIFFKQPDAAAPTWSYKGQTPFYEWWQFESFKSTFWVSGPTKFHERASYQLAPFVKRYFTPSDEIQAFAASLETTHAIDWDRTVVLFYRGNDKATEMKLPAYEAFWSKARELQAVTPGLRLLLQSDETEFLEGGKAVFPDALIFWEHIRHIPRANTTVDKACVSGQQHEFAKKFLAIVWLMSKARWVVCPSGNISMWIVLYRGHTKGIYQMT